MCISTQGNYGIEAADKFHRGWLKTGDIAVITERAQMANKDRSKDMIEGHLVVW